jgi:hypothetical protein
MPSEAHVGTAALDCPGRNPNALECEDERKSWRTALAWTAEGGGPYVVLAPDLVWNVTVKQR